MVLSNNTLNFDENEINEICNSDTCFLNPLKRKENEAERYLHYEGTLKAYEDVQEG